MNRSKQKGTAAETCAVEYLRLHGFPFAERRALTGSLDKGDINAAPGLCFEVKAGKTLKLREWLRETKAERGNARADHGVLVIKPVGVAGARTGEWYALMSFEDVTRLLRQAGYGDPE